MTNFKLATPDDLMPDSAKPSQFLAVGRQWLPRTTDLPNALTCDVEDWFQVSAFEHLVTKESWGERECRIPRNVDRILALYDQAGVHGTFFTLGWVAEHYPEVVRRIAAAGHEVASHGMQHRRVWDQSPEEFRADITRAKALLEDVSGQSVCGYRAASWSLSERTPWAHSIIGEAGYKYSSSIYPIAHDHYGLPDAPTRPFYVRSTGILEIPASTARVLGRNIPASGGGYFRLLPFVISRCLMSRIRRVEHVPLVFYFHPWELDPGQPRMSGIHTKTKIRHYLNLRRFESRLIRLLRELAWGRMDDIYLAEST